MAHRFEQVAERLRLEGGEGVLVVRRHEDHRGGFLQRAHVPRRLDAVHAGHADVEQYHVRNQPRAGGERLRAIAGFPHHRHVLHRGEHAGESLARRQLVVDDQDADGRGCRGLLVHGGAAFSAGPPAIVTTDHGLRGWSPRPGGIAG
jgi:hypothetical protein